MSERPRSTSRVDRARAESALRKRFPRQFARPISIEVGPGWLPLVGEMLAEVDGVLERRHKRIAWTRIYSKYASLRADFETPEYDKAWAREIEAIIGRYEVRSTSRCERCGKAGTAYERGGWICIACEDHAPAREPGTRKTSRGPPGTRARSGIENLLLDERRIEKTVAAALERATQPNLRVSIAELRRNWSLVIDAILPHEGTIGLTRRGLLVAVMIYVDASDRQIEPEVRSGRLEDRARKALHEPAQGRTKPL